MRKHIYLAAALFPAFLTGCQKDKIEVYQVSAEPPSATPAGAPRATSGGMPGATPNSMPSGVIPEAPQGSSDEIQWKVPRGWKQQPATGMRLGSFSVTGANGQQADVSVIPLAGAAGSHLANINRWREQVNTGRRYKRRGFLGRSFFKTRTLGHFVEQFAGCADVPQFAFY